MLKVFLSYRRGDSQDVTGRIYDALVEHFPRECVFKDVDSIPLGRDFRRVLTRAVEKADVVLAVIGPSWLTAVDTTGRRRLDDPDDFVRFELETALQLGKRVIPVTVSNTPMIRADDLPGPLQQLAFQNGLPVRPDPDFHTDMARLIAALGGGAPAQPPRRSRNFPLGAIALVGILLLLLGVSVLGGIRPFFLPHPGTPQEHVPIEIQIERLRSEIAKLDQDIDQHLSRLAERTVEVSQLRGRVAAAGNEEERQAREAQLKARETALATFREQLASLRETRSKLAEQLTQLETEVMGQKLEEGNPAQIDPTRMDDIKAKLDKIQEDLEKKKKEQELKREPATGKSP